MNTAENNSIFHSENIIYDPGFYLNITREKFFILFFLSFGCGHIFLINKKKNRRQDKRDKMMSRLGELPAVRNGIVEQICC